MVVDGRSVSLDEVRTLFNNGELGEADDREQLVLDALLQHAPDASRLLDAGCYTGRFLKQASAVLPSCQLFGIDSSLDHVVICHALYPELADFTSQMSAYRLGFADGVFDCVTFQEVIEHLDRPVDAVREINRVLRLGGLLVLSTPNANAAAWRLMLSSLKSRLLGRGGYRPAGNAIYFENVPWNRHLYSWTPVTLNTLLLVNGFEYVSHYFFHDNALGRVLPELGAGMVFVVRKVCTSPRTLV